MNADNHFRQYKMYSNDGEILQNTVTWWQTNLLTIGFRASQGEARVYSDAQSDDDTKHF